MSPKSLTIYVGKVIMRSVEELQEMPLQLHAVGHHPGLFGNSVCTQIFYALLLSASIKCILRQTDAKVTIK